jgi:2-polyprenyl-3-methyl-5-hydroxy-6-metoxy-1,4-benzoquinol methylase
MNRASLYDEEFTKVFPFQWELSILKKHSASTKTLIDVGCGTGRHIIPLAEKGIQISGIDKDKEYIKAARSKLESKGLMVKVDLVMADARFLPFRRHIFDTIVCMGNVLGDVDIHNDERAAILREVILIAKSGAIFIMEFVHRYWRPTDLFIWICRYLATSIEKLSGKPVEYGDYTENIKHDNRIVRLKFHAFTTREAKQLLTSQRLQATVEKRARFFHDWFILVAMSDKAKTKGMI